MVGVLPMLAAWLVVAAPPGDVVLVSFDGDTPSAEVNSFGGGEVGRVADFRLTPPGGGCPSNPAGRALDAGFSDGTAGGRLVFGLPKDADLRQGTVELWFRPRWATGAREGHTLFQIKLQGGVWNGIWLGYHGTIGPTTEAFGANIMDGLDHPCYVHDAKTLGWEPGVWHHVAFTWTQRSEYLFVDGGLVAQLPLPQPLQIRGNEGELWIGARYPSGGWPAGGLIDEFRFCNVPLYSPDAPPRPGERPTADLGLGLAALRTGAEATADATSPPVQLRGDVPALHDGWYGEPATRVGGAGKGLVWVELPREEQVAAFEWSRDGSPYAGEQGQGYARLMPWPRDFVVEVSEDGETWQEVYGAEAFDISPQYVAEHENLRFRHDFGPRAARHVRMRILAGPRGNPAPQLDEVAVYAADGRSLAREDGARVFSDLTMMTVEHEPSLALDGRWGEESCWRSATPGRGVLTVKLPEPAEVSRVVFSRSREGLESDGTPSAGRVEVSADGEEWQAVGGISGADPKPREVAFAPRQARFVRLVITATTDGREPAVDDLRLY